MSLIEGTLKNYLNPILVETGTYLGDGIEAAKNAGFNKILSIEVSKMMCEKARERFEGDNSITVIYGDSVVALWPAIENIEERMTFVLDSHNLDWAKDTKNNKHMFEEWPLVKEIQIIAKHPRKDHTVIIDDVRLFGLFNTTVKKVRLMLLEINPDYRIYFIKGVVEYGKVKSNEIMIAEIKRNE